MACLYLDFPCVVGNDEAQQYDCRQADQTLQGQRIHGALGRETLTGTFLETCRGKKNNNNNNVQLVCEWSKQNVSKYTTKNKANWTHIYTSCYFLLCWNCTGTRTALHLSGDNSTCKKTDFQKLVRSRMIVFCPSISHCGRALSPLLVWFHRAYNQCAREFPINTTHSTSVASLTLAPHLLRVQQQQRRLEWTCLRIICVFTKHFSLIKKQKKAQNCRNPRGLASRTVKADR